MCVINNTSSLIEIIDIATNFTGDDQLHWHIYVCPKLWMGLTQIDKTLFLAETFGAAMQFLYHSYATCKIQQQPRPTDDTKHLP